MKTAQRISIGGFLLLLVACFPGRQLSVSPAELQLSEQDSMYVVDISYPKVRGSAIINDLIRQKAQENLTNFRQFIENYPAFAERRLTGTYELSLSNAVLFSLRQQYEWAVPGVPILLQHFGNVNIDRRKRQEIRIADLFAEGADYSAVLRPLIAAKIDEEFPDADCNLYSGETFEDFTLHDTFVRFYLDLYQGDPTCQFEAIDVRYSAIEALLATDIKAVLPAFSQN